MKVTFITGNQDKARLLAKYIGHEIRHQKLELEEIQSLELDEIVEHKVHQAYVAIEGPVLVEDVALSFTALGGLPGPFIKWFEKAIGLEAICRLVDSFPDRGATASVCFGFYDGHNLHFFEGDLEGSIAENPRQGPSTFGWNPIFIPDGLQKTLSEMSEAEHDENGLREQTVYPALKLFLDGIDKT